MPMVRGPRVRSERGARLTVTEADVLGLLFKGHSTEEIARLRGCAFVTVENHFDRMREKTGTHTRTELIRRALAEGWLQAPQISETAREALAGHGGPSSGQVKVLQLVFEGRTNKQIARACWRDISNIERKIQRMMKKLEAQQRSELIYKALSCNWLQPPKRYVD